MRILLLHVPAGAGHQRACEAIAAAFHERGLQIDVTVKDALIGGNRIYRWAFTKGYIRLIHSFPFLWGIAYYLTDIRPLNGLMQRLHRLSNAMHGSRLSSYLIEKKPDVIIGTHFFPMEVAGWLKSRGKITSRLITVVTDYQPHALWAAPGIDTYVVASPEAGEELRKRGIPPDKIKLIGIPVDPKFSFNGTRPELVKKLGLKEGTFTVLVGSGGAGTGPVVALVKALCESQEPVQMLVVAGSNTSLFEKLVRMKPSLRHPVHVYGFINNMDELMEIADLVVSKPGGLTCTEALAKQVPLVLVAPIPGQETNNAKTMVSMGVAVWARNVQAAAGWVQKLRNNRPLLEEMRQKAKEQACPDAAARITRLVMP
ncbi:MAG: glycosyltransferase [Candidatus Omnitrophica bacterium]|nr:glycosyltransferase [Candidatus Omnitrophota bacterium]